jgi:hypothetical protein
MKEMKTPVGFLVVLATESKSESFKTRTNEQYVGVNNVPPWPTDYPEEEDAMWDYVFNDDFKDETNLISSWDKAVELHKRLSQGSRKFEIIFCCQGPDSDDMRRLGSKKIEHLGYDVAGIVDGDYYSIVNDFSNNNWANAFRAKLNEFGLFDYRHDAEQYAESYKAHGEPDADVDFDIVYVVRILTEK